MVADDPTLLGDETADQANEGNGASARSDFRPGAAIDRYVVTARLGAGSMGVVYAAYDPKLDRKVAVKVLHTGPNTDRRRGELARQRLFREARSLARLQHANVVAVHDVGRDDGRVFLAMELINGVTLRTWLAAQTRPWRELVDVFLAAGRGLEAAHATGMIHRDFKPDNVMVASDGRVVVMDFGLARATLSTDDDDGLSLDSSESHAADPSAPSPPAHSGQHLGPSLTRTGAIMGTLAYMPPEQYAGGAVDARSDQFAFSVALYEALYGQRPYHGTTAAELLWSMTASSTALRAPRGPIPGKLHDIVARGLEVDPGSRYADMAALLSALLAYRRPRRRRAWASMGIAALTTAGVATVMLHEDAAPATTADCREARTAQQRSWHPDQRERLRSAFGASGLSFANASFDTVAQSLDRYIERWVHMRVQVCQARAHAPDSALRALAERDRCLDARLRYVDALVGLFLDGDTDVIEHAPLAVGALPAVSECGEGRSLGLDAFPDDPELQQEYVQLGEQEAAVVAFHSAQQSDRTIALGTEVAEHAALTGAFETQLRVLLLVSRATSRRGDFAHSERMASRALFVAERLGQDAPRAVLLIELASASGSRGRLARARWYLDAARAVVARVASPPALRRRLLTAEGKLLLAERRPERARAKLARAKRIEVPDSNSSALTKIETLLAGVALISGKQEAALTAYRAVERIEAATFSDDHPAVAVARINVGAALIGLGKYQAATKILVPSIGILEDAHGDDSVVLNALNSLALAEQELGQLDAAAQRFSEVLEHTLRTSPRSAAMVAPLCNLAQVELLRGRTAESLAFAERAVTTTIEVLGEAHPYVGIALFVRGEARLAAAQVDEAEADLERAIVLLDGATTDPIALAEAQFALARALRRPPQACPRCTALSAAARAVFVERGPAGARRLRQLDAWRRNTTADATATSSAP